jgi:transcriptional regulator of met regulon
MDSLSANPELYLESELIDLGTVPLTVLRVLDTTRIRRALRHVVKQSDSQRLTETNSESQLLTETDAEPPAARR